MHTIVSGNVKSFLYEFDHGTVRNDKWNSKVMNSGRGRKIIESGRQKRNEQFTLALVE
ncbi:hypothetical protein ACFL17_01835 [Pseudomonadota bacterium]